MKVQIEIDNSSGFCNGVVRAIKTAEENLSDHAELYSLGAIVHNNSELDRLEKEGLKVIDLEQMSLLSDTTVLIRAHGEPPSTYELAKRQNIKLIDCTCPVVLQLQKKIADTDGQIVIFGKIGHAEVNGLVGRAEGRAIVVENIDQIDKVDFSRPVNIFSQTTKDPDEFERVCNRIREKMADPSSLTIHNTICRQVAQRHSKLTSFAKEHNVIIFVSGKESSNGKVLYELCRQNNPRSYNIQSLSQIDRKWFKNGDKIGVCGATSTPKWQLTSCATFLKIRLKNYICSKLYSLLYGNYSRF
ncbi:MAG: 4-hydroxy-3-methylbut-2-enyl diphosphate reductase [Bacteroidales bacterium]|nr:4-hydroxy-3-methylbut-2-enyl diphosphate reductase [Bacteroidales bacterium]MBQ2482640.1 4-hydroxy-3-methylbut-2-enyl diphosphate reductase [Bacteroidales bacterium]MBQ2493008.1 4-hydroxy-3-methylbut-2-enyl diphosphate reductase [Bacteroidales bacterium]MBQ4196524.1 4-hydroxy-3-methylbut-2-enyl diphosphate reductase [Bacteroidales bacterium]